MIVFKDKCTSIFFVLKEAILCLLSFKYFCNYFFVVVVAKEVYQQLTVCCI